MSRPEFWKGMVKSSRAAIEDFQDLYDDKAIVWADVQLECYKEALLALVTGNSNWRMSVTDDQEKLIETMIRRAESQ